MGDCVVEDGHGHHHSEAVEGAVPMTVAVELDERAGESREEGGGQRKKVGGIRREPSFSRWCRDPSVAAASNTAAAAATSDSDDSEEFELPLLPSSSGGGSSPMDIEAGATARSDDLPISPRLLAKVIGLIACWYTLSTCLTLYNKEMLGKHMWKFPAPFLMNTVHFTMQAVASRAIVWFQQRGLEGGPSKMSWKDYCLRVVPTALATALDINLSNISLVFITVTFATMCKSASPIFILLFAFMFRLEKPSFSLLGIMLIVSFGVLLTVAKEAEFNLWGFIFIMLAAVMAGFRWSMTQILLQAVQSFCEEHGIPRMDMDEDYIDRHRPRKKTNRTNYQHYRYDCFNPIIDLQLAEFNDRFNEVNSQLLTQIATFNPKNSFEAFKSESLMELAKSYPDDFDSTQLRDLGRELNIYIDNVRADERFANLNTISELAKLMVGTNKHLGFPLVYRLLKLVLVLPVATASVERCFSAMKIVKTILRNRIGDGFMNDCIVCFVEQEFLATIPIADVIIRFHKMEDRNRRGNL